VRYSLLHPSVAPFDRFPKGFPKGLSSVGDRIDGSDEFSMNLPCLEGKFSEVRQDFIANSSQAAQMLTGSNMGT
jgi:hypothetical protein